MGLMLPGPIVKCRSSMKQCGGAVWTLFDGSALEDILGEREKFFKPALALFRGAAGGEEARACPVPDSSWTLTSASSSKRSHLKAATALPSLRLPVSFPEAEIQEAVIQVLLLAWAG